MIKCKEFFGLLQEEEIRFYAGVPDSLLKSFCAYLTDHTSEKEHIIAANEGNAIALACGYHLATGKIGLVYMQNAGEGNAVNPLLSLADSEVYSIPLLMLIGWRGEPEKHDEPQHVKQGKVTLELLEAMKIPYEILPDSWEGAKSSLGKVVGYMAKHQTPYALVIRKGTFEEYKMQKLTEDKLTENIYSLSREEALKQVVDALSSDDLIVSTTGMLSRELFEYREALQQGHERDFLTVGSMGHSSSIALGLALEKPERNIYCFDGDGAALMHLGAQAIIGKLSPQNFRHLIFNNGAHDSVGGQPTAAFNCDFPAIAKACGYKQAWRADTKEELEEKLRLLQESSGPGLLEIRLKGGNRKDLGRPTTTPIENKRSFMRFLSV
ncbi:MAG TPA: phosphonopyruvate decarboxylase [Candidatus Nanoarchaeia archaeon]|nr:phosphonopyruvate decarboxylase [Candidatus Nanoarchaeia archaeon]